MLSSTRPIPDVVEIGLLLPAPRAEALMALSRSTRRTVGQILRDMIDRELAHPGGLPCCGASATSVQ